MEELAIQLWGVCKRYPHFSLDQVNLSVPAGTIMGFLGENGAGKSTTLRILMGLVQQDSGEATVLGCPMPAEQARAKQEIGYVSEDLRLYGMQTLDWHMRFVAPFYPRWDAAYAQSLLRSFNLSPAQRIKGMSHGQRVKAALLLVLARRPRLLVLDEPTTGLDPIARHDVLAALMEVMADDGRSILFSSHNTQDVEQIADAITFIDRGRIVGTDDKESFIERWRRIRLEVPAGVTLPTLPGTIALSGGGRLQMLTTSLFSPALVSACQDAGASVLAVDSMSLEEIFVSKVIHQRGASLA